MSIKYPSPPSEGSRIIHRSLKSIFSRDTPENREALRGSDVSQIRVVNAHQCYFTTLGEIADGRLLSTAVPRLWRYLLYIETRVIADAELYIDSTGELRLAAVNYGPVAAETDRAARRLETEEIVIAGVYELRCLEIPPLHYVAIWAHSATDDLITAIDPTPRDLFYDGIVFSEARLRYLLQPVAIDAIRENSAADPGSGG